jgi:hypothetical protein
MQRAREALVTLTLLAAAACAPDRTPVAPTPDAAPSAAARASRSHDAHRVRVQRRLERAAEGLLYTSESDYPFDYFFRAATVRGALTPETFRAILGEPPGAEIEERSLDDFFARHIERVDPNDPVAQALVPRYRRLRETIRRSVNDVRVFRSGSVVIRCYVVGTDRNGNVVGLETTAIET